MGISETALAPELIAAIAESSVETGQILAAAWGAVPGAVLIFDNCQNLVYANADAKQRLTARGLPVSGSLFNAIQVFDPDTQVRFPPGRLPLARALGGEAVEGVELLVRPTHLGTCFWIECGARPLRDKSGNIRAAILVFRDITAR
ncbi:MAG TPA: PAS domain-containing protein, partial [Bryobacteraceae bacterium]|nr:PAS domain-containing protein [Bryobacteraceae bacterium]